MRSFSLILFGFLALASPAHAQPLGAQPMLCDKVAIGQGLVAGTTQLIVGVPGVVINLCGFKYDLNANGTAQLVFGTGSSCTSSTNVTANITTLTNDHIIHHLNYAYLSSAPGQSLCIIVTGTGSVLNADIFYLQRP